MGHRNVPTYHRGASEGYAVVDRWEDGVGWIAHPEESARRASHALVADGGVWLFDPLDAPDVESLLAEYGEVVGVAVCSAYHARDAGTFAERHDVPVTVPNWLDRVEGRIDAPVERVDGEVAGFELRPVNPLSLWREVLAYRPEDGTLYVPDYLSAHDAFTVGEERLGLPTFSRLRPPRAAFEDLAPERILLGHGAGVFADAEGALADTLEGARRRFPRALLTNFPLELRAMLGALR